MRRILRLTTSVAAVAVAFTISPAGSLAQQTGTITGQVITSQGEFAASVPVRLLETGRMAMTDADGRFVFEDLSPGRYVLRVEDERYGAAVERVELGAGTRVVVDLILNPLYHVDELVVTASPSAVTREELYQAAQALSGRALRQRMEASLGETVGREPGVNASYFGPASSRPVIRGLGSDRVRVLENGLGSGDISSSSPDHAVAVEPASADRIEVVRGPATLLYGSSAIGGVVNVIDGRVPEDLPGSFITGDVTTQGATAADERMVSGKIDGNVGIVAYHGSGVFRETGDYSIPGFAEADHDGDGAGEPGDEDEVEGVLENSALQNSRWVGGLSLIGERGHFGVSVSGYDNEYGVPGHGHEEEGEEEEEHEEEGVSVDLRQRRLDAQGTYRFGEGPIQSLKGRLGFADYRHHEIESSEIGTVFENDYWEGRLEMPHTLARSLTGAVGIQASRRDFSAIGEEAFVPPNETDLFAVFLFQEYDTEPVTLQGGLRWEHQSSVNETDGFDTSFDGVSASAGLNWDVSEPLGFAVSVARSVKLPSADELFSDGPHLATNSFEIGSTELERELATSVDATLHLHTGRFEGELTAFVNSFDDFIYQEFAGEERQGLQVLRYIQGDARFVGYESQLHVELAHAGERHLELELWSDYTRATLTDPDDPLPRIPPLRWGAGIHFEGAPWTAILRGRRITGQDRVAPNEEPTEGYSMVDLTLGYRIVSGDLLHEITLAGRNLLDEEARNHISLLKEVAPFPGRDLRLTYRLAF